MKRNRRIGLLALFLCVSCVLSSCGGNGDLSSSSGQNESVPATSERSGKESPESQSPSSSESGVTENAPSQGRSSGGDVQRDTAAGTEAASGDNSEAGKDSGTSDTRGDGSEAQSPQTDQAAPDFLTAEQRETYLRAKGAFTCFNVSTSAVDYLANPTSSAEELEAARVTLDGVVYYKARGALQSYQEFQDYMLSVFTTEYLAELNSRPSFASVNGELYYSDGDRGTNNLRDNVPDTFELVSQSEERIEFKVSGTYFSMEQHEKIDQAFQEAYAAASGTESEPDFWVNWWSRWKGEDTGSYPLVMVKTQDGWRFSKFNLTF